MSLYTKELEAVAAAIRNLSLSIDNDPFVFMPSTVRSITVSKLDSTVSRQLQGIFAARSHTSNLETELALIRKKLDRLHSETRQKLACINILPPELIRSILSIAYDSLPLIKDRFHLTLRISQVSRAWRALTLDHSSLWCSLDLKFAKRELLEAFASRSLERKMSAGVTIQTSYDKRKAKHWPHWDMGFKRWRTLSLYVELISMDDISIMNSIAQLPFSSLEEVQFMFGPDSFGAWQVPWDWMDMPKLQRFVWYDHGELEFRYEGSFPHTLVSLVLHSDTVWFEHLRAIFSQCPQLEICQIRTLYLETNFNASFDPPPRLNTFIVNAISPLDLNNLIHLTSRNGSWDSLRHFGIRFFDEAILSGVIISLNNFFSAAPNVTGISFRGIDTHLLSLIVLLHRDHSSSALLPGLRFLDLHKEDRNTRDERFLDVLNMFVSTRCNWDSSNSDDYEELGEPRFKPVLRHLNVPFLSTEDVSQLRLPDGVEVTTRDSPPSWWFVPSEVFEV